MRFPKTPFMKRTFELAERLPVKLIPYIMDMPESSPNTFLFYNNSRAYSDGTTTTGEQLAAHDPFKVSGYVTEPGLATRGGALKRVKDELERFRAPFRDSGSIAEKMENLFKQTNGFSMRSYLTSLPKPMSPKDINWCETHDNSTGGYDRSLTEST